MLDFRVSCEIVLLVLLAAYSVTAERCPPIFGDFECPMGFTCKLGTCKDAMDHPPPTDCAKVTCHLDSKCLEGKCYPIENLPCDRNVLVAENTARSIVSDCGRRGKCINGRCVIDKCAEVLCTDGELCREGKCVKMLDNFCFSAFDCGPGLDCTANKCARKDEPPAFAKIECDPGEILEGDKCVAQEGCAQIVCEPGETCLSGICAATVIDCSEAPCPDGLVCQKKVCIADPCKDKCPPGHACINGECRLLQGLLCQEKCPEPFECISGTCVKNECRRKVCQLGERCENGICAKIEGRFCSLAMRDCGEEFVCENAACKDKITALEENALKDSVAKR